MKRSSFLFLILALIALFGAVIAPIGFGDTVRGLRSAASGRAGTFVMEQGDLMMLAWPKGGQWGFAVLSKSGQAVDTLIKMRNGNQIATTTFANFVKDLEAQGWKLSSPANIPPAILSTLTSYSMYLVAMGVQSLPNMLILPAAIFVPFNVEVQS